MTERRIIDLDRLSTDTVAHVTRALAAYSRSVPADRVTVEYLEVCQAVLNENTARAGRRNRLVPSRPESSGVVTLVAARDASADGGEAPTFLTRDELALHWRVSLSSVDRWIGRDAERRCVRLGRSVRIPRALVDAANDAPGATA